MKKPEEIKKGLECCLPRDEEQCGQCPYCIEGCYTTRIIDTLNYIQQLERERDAVIEAFRSVVWYDNHSEHMRYIGGGVMYKSPISLYELDVFTDALKEREEQTLGSVLCTVQKIGVSVDKEELIRALSYDRNQYLRGYRDGEETAQPKWISVEDRLPNESEPVLVYRDGRCGVSSLLDVEPEIMWTYTGIGGDPEYWMPLPEPPEEVHEA